VPRLDPEIADLAPNEPTLMPYDQQHVVTYVRLLDAEKANADWQEVVRIVLHIDPVTEPTRARGAYESHLARAKWMARHGYRQLLSRGWPKAE
jgi:Uncharacterized conserved protein (DUF2285)